MTINKVIYIMTFQSISWRVVKTVRALRAINRPTAADNVVMYVVHAVIDGDRSLGAACQGNQIISAAGDSRE